MTIILRNAVKQTSKTGKRSKKIAVKALAELSEMADTIESYKDTIKDLLNSIRDKCKKKN